MPEFHDTSNLMALDGKSKRVVGLRRELHHNNQVVERLVRRLQEIFFPREINLTVLWAKQF